MPTKSSVSASKVRQSPYSTPIHSYVGGYTAVTDFLREVRPAPVPPFEVRFETMPGEQAQVDFAHFEVIFADEPSAVRKVWLFSLVLGYSRLIWARFVVHQDLQTVLRCHRPLLQPWVGYRARSSTIG